MSPEGSVLDHSKYRWEVGLAVSACIVLIQAAQIATNEKTWLVMTGLEAINASITQVRRSVTDLFQSIYLVDVRLSNLKIAFFNSYFSFIFIL